MSGTGSYGVVFGSRHLAVVVTTYDVNHDRTLDLVVMSPVDRAIVGVWLNDGHGRFEEADHRAFPPAAPAHLHLVVPRVPGTSVAALVPGWRGHDLHVSAGPGTGPPARGSGVLLAHVDRRSHFLPPSPAPRGPPAR